MITIWEKESFYAPQDVVIIGSGLVGLWSAFYLKKKEPSLKITIVDRGIIPTGASTRNAGFACFGSLTEIIYDIKTLGLDATLSLVEKRFKGLERIQKHISIKDIQYEKCGGYELLDSTSFATKEALDESINYINTLLKDITGKKKTYCLTDENIAAFGFGQITHLLRNSEEAYLHSGKLVQTLLQKVFSMGVQVINATEVKTFSRKGAAFEIETNHSFLLAANKLLICTNAFAKELLPLSDVVPARGQILVTSPIKNLPFKGTFHADEGFYYFRNVGNRVLLGGARNRAFDDEQTCIMNTSEMIQNELERYLSNIILPYAKDHYKIDYRWSGIMGMGSEKAPIVKEIEPDLFCAIRMSGMGVALAPVVAQEISALMY